MVGEIDDAPIAEFMAAKQQPDGTSETIRVRMFPLAVSSERQRWPEDHQRERRWLSLKRAIKSVEDPAIRKVPKRFADARRHRT